ncbi:MAG: hypothetical protein AUG51_11560 [Acidobacteria bacterium 13_1_20CM_3_53_8]|nr:MAG: hypothetical protein AUG51_11560 [Acidobacteria bacterium 13_1_20CM_3_53_8]
MIFHRFSTKSNRPKILLPAFVALFFCLFVAAASISAQQDQPVETISVNTSLVQLNVGVVDRQGHAITNLTASDFAVYEDGVRQNIASFEATDAPFSLVLLLDMSASTQNFRTSLKQAALRFLDALAPEDRISVIVFNGKVQAITGFTLDRRKTVEAIRYGDERLGNSKGETQLYKAMRYSLNQLNGESRRRKAIVVLTDGLDTEMRNQDRTAAAHAQTDAEAIAAVKPNQSAALNAVLNEADHLGVTIYPLALPSGDPRHLPFPDPTITAIYTSARARLQTLADRTGGHLSEINHLEDLGRLYAEVAAELRTLYSIRYQSSNAHGRDGRWRAIRIDVTQPELIARTRPGYFAR